MQNYRREAGQFVMDVRPYSNPMTLHRKRALMDEAIRMEHITKGYGCRNGALGDPAIKVLRCLLEHHNDKTGLCCPSYKRIRERTNLCLSSISKALKILESAGLLRIKRRIVKKLNKSGQMVCEQGSNLYTILRPEKIFVPLVTGRKPKNESVGKKLNNFGRLREMERNRRGPVDSLQDSSFGWLLDDKKVGFQGEQAAGAVDWKARTRLAFGMSSELSSRSALHR